MNEVINAILSRRSIRSFNEKPVSKEDLELILKAAVYAPSAKNLQTWKFTALTKREDIDALAAAVEKVLGREGYDMYRPNVLIIPSNEKDSPFGRDDNACALQNIFLAAYSLGIGSVWINQLVDVSFEPEIRALLTKFGIPEDHIVYGMAALGYTDEALGKDKEKTGEIKII